MHGPCRPEIPPKPERVGASALQAVAAVKDQDEGRVAVLQGPVATRWIKRAEEPMAEVLHGLHDGYVGLAKAQYKSEARHRRSQPRFKPPAS